MTMQYEVYEKHTIPDRADFDNRVFSGVFEALAVVGAFTTAGALLSDRTPKLLKPLILVCGVALTANLVKLSKEPEFL